MRTFLCRDRHPIIKWGNLPDNTFYEGRLPEGYNLAISPSPGYIIVDVDRHNGKDGFKNIPKEILEELEFTLNYATKNNGRHYWLKYTGYKQLANKTSGKSFDLRTNKGYVIWWLNDGDIRDWMYQIQETSTELNKWLEDLFSYKN